MKTNRLIFSFVALLFSAQVFSQEPTFTFVSEVAGGTETVIKAGNIYVASIEEVGVKAFDSNGAELWIYSDIPSDSYFDIKADNDGNIYVYLYDYETKIVYIKKFNNAGTELWSRQSQSTNASDIRVSDLAIDDLGNVYITGSFYADDINFSTVILTNTTGYYNYYIFKINSNGDIQWGESGDFGYNRDIYINGSDIYLANSWHGLYLTKYNTNGDVIWSFSAGSSDDTNGIENVLIDNDENIFITGFFESESLDFGDVTLNNSNTTYGFSDMFLAKLNPAGNLLFVNSYQVNAYDGLRSISTINNENNITITGNFRTENVTFAELTIENPNYKPITEYNSGGSSLFIVQFNEEGTALWAKSVNGDYLNGNFDDNGNLYLFTYCDENGIKLDDITIEFNGDQLEDENMNSVLFKIDKNGTVIYGKNIGATWITYVNETEILFGGAFYQSLTIGDNNLTAGEYGFYIALLESKTTSINSVAVNKNILIYPNPASDLINIITTYDDETKFELYDISGILMLSERVNKTKNISLYNLRDGIYFYRLIAKDKIESGKLIKK